MKVRESSPGILVHDVTDRLADLGTAVTRQAERLAAVVDIGAALSSARDVDELLRLVIERVSALTRAQAASLFMVDPETGELWSRVLRGSSLKEIRIPAGSGIAGHVVRTGETVVVADAYQDSRFNQEIDRRSGFRTRSLIAAPLRHLSGRILGVVEVLHRKAGAFSHTDRQLVETLSTQIAGVVDNVLLLEELRHQNEALRRAERNLSDRVRELDLLYEIERAISASERQEDLLDTILGRAMDAIGARAGSVLLCADDDEGTLFFRSTRGDRSDDLKSLRLSTGQGIAGHVALSGESVRVDDAEKSPHHDRSIPRRLGVNAHEILCVAIPGEKQRPLGALELLNKPGGFTVADERLATVLAGQTGRAILRRREREHGERKARLASIGQMISGVLHDLRTPMTIIDGYVHLMVGENSVEERQKLAEVVQRQFEHIQAMTRETLAFARGEQELLLRKIYVKPFVDEVAAFLAKDFEGSGVELKTQVGYTGVARLDENKIKRVIYNIARNAVQAMPKGGRFVFSVDKENENLVFRFQDTGTGIPPEIADRIFGEFVTAGKASGTGLGLAIVKRIAEEHHGTVSCKSRPGKGTTFEVSLPLGANGAG